MSEENKTEKIPQYLATASICVGALAGGTLVGWSANITGELKQGKLNGFKMDENELGWAGSSMTLGAMVACFPIGFIADTLGRKPAVLLMTIPFVVGWLFIILAQHVAMVYVGRFLTGIAGGSTLVTGPLYTNEIAEVAIRGSLGTFVPLFLTIGILISQILGYAVPLLAFHIILLAIPIAFAVLFMFQPETPVYLVRKGKMDKAKAAFKRLRGKDYDPAGEIKIIQEEMAKEAESPGWKEGMKFKSSKKAMLICLMLMMYLQMSGINAVLFYSFEIFSTAGSSLPAYWCVIIVGLTQTIVTGVSAWTIERFGRKILLITSCFIIALSSFLLGLFFTIKNYELVDEYGIQDIGFLPLLSLITYIIGFSIGLGPVPWVVSFEVFSPAIKAKSSAIGVTVTWFVAFLVTRFYLNIVIAIGNDITFYIFAGFMVSTIFFVIFVVPETKGKTFEQIRDELEGIQ